MAFGLASGFWFHLREPSPRFGAAQPASPLFSLAKGVGKMNAMVLKKIGAPLEWTELADRQPGAGEIRVKMAACGVCRTDLHVVEGELPDPKIPVIPGHKIVGRIDALGAGVEGLQIGETLVSASRA